MCVCVCLCVYMYINIHISSSPIFSCVSFEALLLKMHLIKTSEAKCPQPAAILLCWVTDLHFATQGTRVLRLVVLSTSQCCWFSGGWPAQETVQSHWAPCAFTWIHPHTKPQSRCSPQLFSPFPSSMFLYHTTNRIFLRRNILASNHSILHSKRVKDERILRITLLGFSPKPFWETSRE